MVLDYRTKYKENPARHPGRMCEDRTMNRQMESMDWIHFYIPQFIYYGVGNNNTHYEQSLEQWDLQLWFDTHFNAERFGSHGLLLSIMRSCNHTIQRWHMATLTHGHTSTAIETPWGEYTYNNTNFNTNFIHLVAYYMSQPIQVMIIIKGPRPGIDLVISSPQGKHANHYTNRDRQWLCWTQDNWYNSCSMQKSSFADISVGNHVGPIMAQSSSFI